MMSTSQVSGTVVEASAEGTDVGLPEIGARLDRLGSSRTVWTLIVLLCTGGFFDAYMLSSGSNIAPSLVHSGILKATTESFFSLKGYAGFTGATFMGMLLANAFISILADKFGRRTVFTFGLVWFSLCGLIMALQTVASGLIFWRFMMAIGMGLEVITIDSYLSELIPKASRGRAFVINNSIHSSGQPMAALMAFLLVPQAFLGLEGWRWVVLIGTLGAIVVWPLRLFIPESARWLAAHGRLAEADKIVSTLERRVERETGRPLPPPRPVTHRPPHTVGRYSQIFGREYRGRTLMLSIFHVLQGIGLYGFINWMPTFLVHRGVSISHSLGYTFGMALVAPLGPLMCLTFADRIERKWQIVWSALAIAAAGLSFAFFRSPYIIIPIGGFELLSAAILSYNFHAYQAELFPTRIRVQAVGFVYCWARISGTFSGFLIAYILGHFGVSWVFLLIAGSMALVALFIGLMGPPSKNRSLEVLSP
jgi:putative MFS transporter